MITPSEMEDFDAEIRAAGFDVEDFNPIALEDNPEAVEPHRMTGTVTVTRRSTNQATTYKAGYGSTWVADFVGELRSGRFGTP